VGAKPGIDPYVQGKRVTATLDEGIFDHLTSHQGLSALIGTRLHPDYFPETEPLPAIAYSLEDDRSVHTQQGPSALRQAVYRFDIWADTIAETTAVMRQLRSALDGYRGGFKDIPIVGVLFDGAGRTRDPDTEAFNVSMRFTIHYQEI
jgi:hypothetical protein